MKFFKILHQLEDVCLFATTGSSLPEYLFTVFRDGYVAQKQRGLCAAASNPENDSCRGGRPKYIKL